MVTQLFAEQIYVGSNPIRASKKQETAGTQQDIQGFDSPPCLWVVSSLVERFSDKEEADSSILSRPTNSFSKKLFVESQNIKTKSNTQNSQDFKRSF